MSEWISVDQGLPLEGKYVILALESRWVGTGWRRRLGENSKAGEWNFNNHPTRNITHWMPFPAPPEAK